jgi:hypothetical protein
MWEDNFQMGFWHPFGPYTGLTTDQVLEWKRSETERYGWTFWSFAYSPSADAWLRRLNEATGPIFVLCSHSLGARDPDEYRGGRLATHFSDLDESEWKAMPDPFMMKVTNPFKRRNRALAFKVRRVVALDPAVPPFTVSWYAKREERWRSDSSDRLPTRGEFLIRRGGSVSLRPVSALLELVPPYVQVLKREAGAVDAA